VQRRFRPAHGIRDECLALHRHSLGSGRLLRWDFVHGSAQININATVPLNDIAGRPANPDTDPATGVWGQVRDQTAAVVAAGGTFDQGTYVRTRSTT
jgi:hypothetical protein